MPSSEKSKRRHKRESRSSSPEKERRHKHTDHSGRKRKEDRHERRHRSRSPDDHVDERRPIKREPSEDRHKSKWERDDRHSAHHDNDHHGHRVKREPRNRGYADEEERERNNERRRDNHRQRRGRGRHPLEDESKYEFGNPGDEKNEETEPTNKEQPNFAVSGKLAEDTNTYKGVVIKYNEPAEARKPKKHWRWYPFKGEETLPVLHLHRQSAYLLGRDRKVVDIPVDHPSCSKQHAVLQYRLVEYERDDRTMGRRVRPYIIDLGSTNGTYVNNNRIEAQRYVELIEKDVVKFGFSSREYVLLAENTDTTALANDEGQELSE